MYLISFFSSANAYVKVELKLSAYLGNLQKLGQNTEKYGFRYKQSILKSLMSNYASSEVLWLISIQAFKVINLAL